MQRWEYKQEWGDVLAVWNSFGKKAGNWSP